MRREARRARKSLPPVKRWSSPGFVWAAFGVLGVLLLAYLAVLVVRPAAQSWPWLDNWSVAGLEVVGAALCVGRGVVNRPGRLVAVILGLGLLLWACGDIALAVESASGAVPSVPSVADGFYLAFYPVTYVAVGLFMRAEIRRLSAPSWLDGAVAGLGAAAVCAAFAFHRILHSAGGSVIEVATNLAYPVGDLLLFALIVGGTALLVGRPRAPWVLLATGVAVNVVGDTFNLFGSSLGATHAGVTINGLAWPTATLLMAMAVWVRPRPSDLLAPVKAAGFLLPGIAAGAGLIVLVAATLTRLGDAAIALATATLLAVGVRLASSVRGLRTMTEQRHLQSVTDDLTGLWNRRYLAGLLESFFGEQSHPLMPRRELAFLFVDLNRFKEINDSFGHVAGDELLKQLGERFQRSLRAGDALIRIGGDEFAVVLLDADAEYASDVAQRISDCLTEPFELDLVQARIGASIGVALAPDHASSATGLLWCADVAMYRAKLQDTSFALYDQALDRAGDRLPMVEELRVGLDDGQFVLHYQPQLDLTTGRISAAEALVRWRHPTLGLVPPLRFLPLAEEAGLMGELTAWVMDSALQQCAIWRADGETVTVSVNISPTNLLDPRFPDVVMELLRRHHLPPEVLVVEITETYVNTQLERSKQVLRDLTDIGLTVSIDDFGAGATSLAYLTGLSVGELKLDRGFITGLTGDERLGHRERELVRATIDLGHALGLRVVAEGIEDASTLQALRDWGCDLAQGYFIGKPKPASQLPLRANVALGPSASHA